MFSLYWIFILEVIMEVSFFFVDVFIFDLVTGIIENIRYSVFDANLKELSIMKYMSSYEDQNNYTHLQSVLKRCWYTLCEGNTIAIFVCFCTQVYLHLLVCCPWFFLQNMSQFMFLYPLHPISTTPTLPEIICSVFLLINARAQIRAVL